MDVGKIAGEQRAQNTNSAYQQAAFNRINQTGPFGSISYRQSGTDAQGNPIFEQATQLDQGELDYRDQIKGTAFNAYQGGLGALQQTQDRVNRVETDPYGLTQAGAGRLHGFAQPANLNSGAAFDRAYQTASANIEPRMERARAAMENRLRNQGLDPTSEAYRSQMNDLGLQQNEARNDLTTRLQGQMFGQDLAGRQQGYSEAAGLFGTGQNAAQQLFGQDLSGSGFGLQRASQLASQGRSGMVDPILQTGASPYASVNVGNVDLTNLYGQQYQQQMNNYNAEMQQRNAMLGGLGAIGGTLLGLPMGGGLSFGGSLANRFMGGLGNVGLQNWNNGTTVTRN